MIKEKIFKNKNIIQNKYLEWYFELCYSRNSFERKRVDSCYELHHILPKSIFFEYSNLQKNKWNSVLLTPKEHFIAHLLLIKMFRKYTKEYWQMVSAISYMRPRKNNNKKYFPAAFYEKIRKELNKTKLIRENGIVRRILKTEYNPKIHENIFKTDKKVTIVDQNGKSFGVSKDDYHLNAIKNGWKTHSSIFNSGKLRVQTISGDFITIDKTDERIKSGELKTFFPGPSTKGLMPVFNENGICIRIKKEDFDKNIHSPQMLGIGRIRMTNYKENKVIALRDVLKFETDGWVKGFWFPGIQQLKYDAAAKLR